MANRHRDTRLIVIVGGERATDRAWIRMCVQANAALATAVLGQPTVLDLASTGWARALPLAARAPAVVLVLPHPFLRARMALHLRWLWLIVAGLTRVTRHGLTLTHKLVPLSTLFSRNFLMF